LKDIEAGFGWVRESGDVLDVLGITSTAALAQSR
jgi:hypothetical protein